jgi:hypothetical protein
MAGVVPAIHAKTNNNRDAKRMAPLTFIIPQPSGVDARDERGHDEPLATALNNFKVRAK